MNGLKVVKVAELRARLAVIPAKLIMAVLLTGLLFWEGDAGATLAAMSADPLHCAKIFITMYGIVSYVYFFIRIFKNFFVGCGVAAVAAYVLYTLKDKVTDEQLHLIVIIMIVGGPVLDVLRLIRYINLKREVLEESESLTEKIDDIYENVHGYDEGYDRGYNDGYTKGRHERIPGRRNERIEEDYYDDDYSDEEYIEENDEEYIEDSRGGSGSVSGFFEGCRTPEQIRKRYRDLCKVYHPDSGNGSEAIFEAICEEYKRLMDE
jgi:hypothetical protein